MCASSCRPQSRRGTASTRSARRYCEQTPKHPGQLPVVKISNIVKKKTASGFSFTPVFEIIDWVERPDDMPKPRASDQRRPMKAVPIEDIPF